MGPEGLYMCFEGAKTAVERADCRFYERRMLLPRACLFSHIFHSIVIWFIMLCEPTIQIVGLANIAAFSGNALNYVYMEFHKLPE